MHLRDASFGTLGSEIFEVDRQLLNLHLMQYHPPETAITRRSYEETPVREIVVELQTE